MTQRRDFSALVEHLEQRQWPAVSLRGRVIGGSEVQWIRDLPALPFHQLRELERRLLRPRADAGTTKRRTRMSIDATRWELRETITDLADRGKLGSLFSSGQVFSSARAAIDFVNSATETQLEELTRQVHAMADAADAAAERDRRWAEEDERRRTAHIQSDEEREQVEADNERARRIAEAENSTESRLGRIEDVLIRIAGLLEKR
jgi:hypothetical protein